MLIFDKYKDSYQVEGYKQFDTTKPLEAKFLDDGQPINLANFNLRFECLKPDGHIVIQDNNITSRNTNEISMMLDSQVTVVGGLLKCQFVLLKKDGGTQDSTFTFFIDVQDSAIEIVRYSDSVITTLQTINETINEATATNGTLVDTINQAKATNTTLTNTNNTATQTNQTLTTTNQTATTTNQQLTQTNQTATTTKNELNTLNNNATTTKNQLTTINQTATTTKNDLTTLNTNATQTKTDLTAINGTATQTKTDLTAINGTATTTKNDLTQLNTQAGTTKTQLDNSNTTALETKKQLDQSIVNAKNNMAEVSVEDFTGTSIPNLTETKVRIKKADGTYRIPVTRDDAVFVATNKTLKTKISEMDTATTSKFDKTGGTISGAISVAGNVVASKGNIQASAGSITAQNGLVATTGGVTAKAGNIVANAGTVSASGNITSTTGSIVSSKGQVTAQTNVVATTGNIQASAGSLVGNRLKGVTNASQIYIGDGTGTRIDVTGGTFRLFTSPIGSNDDGIVIDADGTVSVKSNNAFKHIFGANGQKTAGTMEIDGTLYGMSPTDSPQTLIEYIIPNVKVENELKLDLDSIYMKMVSYYVAFVSSRNIDIKEKGIDYIILSGNGVTDILIKGQRKGAEDYFRIMGGIYHGKPKEEEPKLEVDSLIIEEDMTTEEDIII